jgi:hypothetical protein
VGGTDHSKRGAVSGCRQPSGVAVRQNRSPFGDQGSSPFADIAADGQVFLFYSDGLLFENLPDHIQLLVPVGFGDPLHSLDTPEQVDRRGACTGHDVAYILQLAKERFMGVGDDVAGPQGDTHGCCHTDGRRSADDHASDGLGHRLEIGVGVVDLLARQPGLVDHDHGVVTPFDGAE